MLVDSHCHLDRVDLRPFGGELAGVLDAAAAAGVGHLLCVGIALETWPAMVEQVAPFANVSLSVGVHPSEDGREPQVAELVRLARTTARVVAIGETGLDYHYGAERGDLQRAWFRTHVRAARETGKPLIVHTREARADTLAILADEGAAEVGGVLHCFTEDWDMAARAVDLNFHVSFSGIVTFKSAAQIQEVARRLPAERMLVETDSPYLAPVPHRGRSNHPAWVREVAAFVAKLRGEPFEQLAATTTGNFFRLFRDAVR
ncbi:MAG TPA: TatD family hydrolase [Plasticicumulans sp.]|uniref:TatD family hydrolase n=1 Tax=Plasticicumulans sp. TaxID=2307179 RepID=UPI002BDB23E2|nr:TatD family hydrolase [Plasticicumulans sp.]HNG48918.1 TatD family hydrolase [Plasticicumulans sp.]HNJ09524.1 TatD family hydrolase [Plasticicumulans sp.]